MNQYDKTDYKAQSTFRSAEMCLCQIFLQSESAYACVAELGELGVVQFRDLSPDLNLFQRKYVNEVRRCDEMERKLRYLEAEINKDKIRMSYKGENPPAPEPREIIDLESTFEKLENELKEVTQNEITLRTHFLELTELKHVLEKTTIFLEGVYEPPEDQTNFPNEEGRALAARLGFVTGVIVRDKLRTFENVIWRVCRGNVFIRQAEIEDALEDPATRAKTHKSVFIIFYQGDQLKVRVVKVCEGFRATIYPCPENFSERHAMAIVVKSRIKDLNIILDQTNGHRKRVLKTAAKKIKVWYIKVRKIKSIFHTLNLLNMDVTKKGLIAECWVPCLEINNISIALRRGTEASGSSVPPILNKINTNETPPTYIHVNKFTSAFQSMIDSYGIASYREINPAPFTIISFPFLFAVMFGDIGHGLIMTLFAAWMVIKEKAIKNKINSEVIVIY
ncbi:unnamed protein product [Brassicogethes aeneus]|uniref:V-type proton ATPase subunit a n=1 Tax=Brassicogethes aeneus TaxID=1431903 RepID=A0A9P0B0W8_BRAAE|nr:unnamed protein product [Brassicogethes aeneus]